MGRILWLHVILKERNVEAAFASVIGQTQKTISATSISCSLFTFPGHISCTWEDDLGSLHTCNWWQNQSQSSKIQSL